MGADSINEKMDAAFRKKLERILPKQTIIARVTSVNRSNLTCDADPVDGGAAYTNVRLQAIIDENDQGAVIIPKEGSYITISIIENDDNNTYMAQCSEIEEYINKIDNLEVSWNKDGIRMKMADHSFKTIMNDMIDELNKIVVINGNTIDVAAMNAIKQRLNTVLKA